MFYQWKTHFFPPWTELFYTLAYNTLIQKVQILDPLNKILITVLVDELEYRQITEGPSHLLLASFSSSKYGCRKNKTPVESFFFFCVLIQHVFFLLDNVTFCTCWDFHVISSFGVRMSAISYTVAKKEHFCCSIWYYNDHLGWNWYERVACFIKYCRN